MKKKQKKETSYGKRKDEDDEDYIVDDDEDAVLVKPKIVSSNYKKKKEQIVQAKPVSYNNKKQPASSKAEPVDDDDDDKIPPELAQAEPLYDTDDDTDDEATITEDESTKKKNAKSIIKSQPIEKKKTPKKKVSKKVAAASKKPVKATVPSPVAKKNLQKQVAVSVKAVKRALKKNRFQTQATEAAQERSRLYACDIRRSILRHRVLSQKEQFADLPDLVERLNADFSDIPDIFDHHGNFLDFKGDPILDENGKPISLSEGMDEYLCGDPTEEEYKIAEDELKERHKKHFEELCFPNGVNAHQPKSKHHTQDRITETIKILRNIRANPDALTAEEKHDAYRVTKIYQLRKEARADNSGFDDVLFRKLGPAPKPPTSAQEKREAAFGYALRPGEEPLDIGSDFNPKEWQRVVPNHELFEHIWHIHRSCGHFKAGTTWAKVKEAGVYTVSEEDCRLFIETCPVCISGPVHLKTPVGAKKPITSSIFCDRFQADLIDFQNDPGVGLDGRIYKWLLVVKDHFTTLRVFRPLVSKDAVIVAKELSFMFGLLGYPLVFHTDNGGEFIAEIVLKVLRDLHPDMFTVQSAARAPHMLGSTEGSHRQTKSCLLSMVDEEKKGIQIPRKPGYR